jgi:hypothetical protein
MKFILSRTAQPKRFSYRPRYYDSEKAALEAKKAAKGINTNLSNEEVIRARMASRWRINDASVKSTAYKRFISLIYIFVALSTIYLIFFTDFIENMLKAFGLAN